MAKYSRLQWIPMIMKAYNDAKERARIPSQDMLPQPGHSSAKEVYPPQMSGTRTSGKQGDNHIKTIRNGVQARGRRKSTPVQRRTYPNAKLSKAVMPSRQLQVMLRELRDTRAKLAKLESIHHRLGEMQVLIEQQLGALMDKVKSPSEPMETVSRPTNTADNESLLPPQR